MYRSIGRVALPLAVPVLQGCASAAGGSAPVSGPVCETGRAVLLVRNDSGRDIEIVETRTGSGGQSVIALLQHGTHDVVIRNDYSYAYTARHPSGGSAVAATANPRIGNRRVTLERQCRPE